jgi:hypothetical protein
MPKPIKKEYNETYINSLLKRGVRDLDLYEVADVYEAVCIDAAEKLAEDEILSELKKNTLAMIKERIRAANASEKLTETKLDDLSRVNKDWIDYMKSVKTLQRDVQILKAQIQKWAYYQEAAMMRIARENKTRV